MNKNFFWIKKLLSGYQRVWMLIQKNLKNYFEVCGMNWKREICCGISWKRLKRHFQTHFNTKNYWIRISFELRSYYLDIKEYQGWFKKNFEIILKCVEWIENVKFVARSLGNGRFEIQFEFNFSLKSTFQFQTEFPASWSTLIWISFQFGISTTLDRKSCNH